MVDEAVYVRGDGEKQMRKVWRHLTINIEDSYVWQWRLCGRIGNDLRWCLAAGMEWHVRSG